MGLSEEAKGRIRTEEAYRLEVRRSHAASQPQPPEPSRLQKLLQILNTPFVLWFLSTVVIALVGWSYALWEEERDARREVRAQQRMLDVEIFSRLRIVEDRLEGVKRREDLLDAVALAAHR